MVRCGVCDRSLDTPSEVVFKFFDYYLGVTSCVFCIRKRLQEFDAEQALKSRLAREEFESRMRPLRGRPKEVVDPLKIRSACNWFVTVSAKEHDTNGVGMWKRCQKMMKRYQASYKLYSIEQKSENPDNVYGFHIHFLLRHSQEVFKAQIIQKFATAFKDFIVGDNSIDVRVENSSHEKYIKGDKQEVKMGKVAVDEIWKTKNNIELYVEHTDGLCKET